MSTQTDFAALIVRIDAATDRLEMDVIELEKLINDAEEAASEEIKQLVAQAKDAATQAQASAQTATQAATAAQASGVTATNAANTATQQVVLATAQVTAAQAQVTLAKQEVINASTQADRAKQEADRAKGIADTLMSSAPFQEAPEDGRTYGRKDGGWAAVEGGSAGTGTVTSVNGVEPDGQGNVTVAIPSKTSELTNDSQFITLADVPTVSVPTKTSELTNDSGFITASDVPTVPTKLSELTNDEGFVKASELPAAVTKTSQLTNDSGFITVADIPAQAITTDAPADGKQYARKDNAWSEVESSGGGIASIPFYYTTPESNGVPAGLVKICFNYALHKVIQEKGAFFWNDAATINPVNTDEFWNTPAVDNPVGMYGGNLALDIRCLRIFVYNADGTVKGVWGASWDGTKWNGNNVMLGVVGQITGEFQDVYLGSGSMLMYLPVGKWFYPASIQKFTSTTVQGLPTAQLGVNHILLEKSTALFGGSANFPAAAIQSAKLLWITAASLASKGEYFWQRSTATWINTGVGTA